MPELTLDHDRVRVVPNPSGLTIESRRIFGEPGAPMARDFLSRAFQVAEIARIEIDARRGMGRLQCAGRSSVPEVLRKLRGALLPAEAVARKAEPTPGRLAFSLHAEDLYLDQHAARPIRIERIGPILSTWRAQMRGRNRVRLEHPLLRNRKDVAFRLEEELTTILGVREFKTSVLTSSVVVRFDPRLLDIPHLARHLERAWPRMVGGKKKPPSRKRFFASFSMLGLAFTGQFLLPVANPFALAAVAIYGFPNVINALKLLRHGTIALPLLYTGTLTFTLLSGMPFSAALMATFMQVWPQLAHGRLIRTQRRLFAAHRQRPMWARISQADGVQVEAPVDSLHPGSVVFVRENEIIPADGVIVEGLAAVDEEALTGRKGALDKAPGDPVYASTFVRAGQIQVRVKNVGGGTLAGHIGARLPFGEIERLPSAAEAEQIANGMVAPALALSAVNLLVTGNVQPSQSTIRPDYATAPRLSAQFTALYSLGDALRRGILLRDPSIMDRLSATDIYVLDDSAALERRRISVGGVVMTEGSDRSLVLGYACAAFPMFQNERARSLLDACVRERVAVPEISGRTRRAGLIRYRDEEGRTVNVATPGYLAAFGVEAPESAARQVAAQCAHMHRSAVAHHSPEFPDEPQLRPLWIIRDGKVLGAVTFERAGELEAVEVIATLRARNRRASFLFLSSRPQAEAALLGAEMGISECHGGLDADSKAEMIEKLGHRTMWIGDGSDAGSAKSIEASEISISVAGGQTITRDAAAVAFLQPTLRSLVPLRHLGRNHRAMLASDYRTIFAANLFCVAGAFFAGFNTLAVAIASNFGTGLVYSSKSGVLSSLSRRMERKMASDILGELDEEDPYAGTSEAGRYERESVVRYHEIDLDAPAPPVHPI